MAVGPPVPRMEAFWDAGPGAACQLSRPALRQPYTQAPGRACGAPTTHGQAGRTVRDLGLASKPEFKIWPSHL